MVRKSNLSRKLIVRINQIEMIFKATKEGKLKDCFDQIK